MTTRQTVAVVVAGMLLALVVTGILAAVFGAESLPLPIVVTASVFGVHEYKRRRHTRDGES